MKKGDKLIRILEFNFFTYPWHLKTIPKLLTIDETHIQTQLNANIIMSLYAFAEGALMQIFKEVLESSSMYKRARDENDTMVFRLLYELLNIRPEGIEGIKKKFNKIEIDLTKFKHWESTVALGQFRNMVAHGVPFRYQRTSIDIFIQEDVPLSQEEILKDNWSGEKFIAYLKKQKLISSSFTDHPLITKDIYDVYANQLFSREVIYHFISVTQGFFKDLMKDDKLQSLKENTKGHLESLFALPCQA